MIDSWIANNKLAQWLNDPEASIEAREALLKDGASLSLWSQEWLSGEGWKRLQANVRQRQYVKDSKKTIQLSRETATDLKAYADELGVSIDIAVRRLLESVNE